MSDAVAAPSPGHELLLGLAGWVDDDLLAIGRELVAVGEEAGALELLVASLAADRTVLPHPVRAGLADAVERRIGGDLGRLLPPGAPLPDRTAHVFVPDAGDLESTARISEVVGGLTAVARSGARTAVTWRLTPAGAAPGPLPHPVVLLVLDDPAPAEVLAYQVGAALARAGVTASVEAFVEGAALPPYQRAALAAAGAGLRGGPPAGRTAAGEPSATPTSATVARPPERDPDGARGTGVRPEEPSRSGPYAAAPSLDTPDPGDRRHARAGEPDAEPSAVDGSGPDQVAGPASGPAGSPHPADHGGDGGQAVGPAGPSPGAGTTAQAPGEGPTPSPAGTTSTDGDRAEPPGSSAADVPPAEAGRSRVGTPEPADERGPAAPAHGAGRSPADRSDGAASADGASAGHIGTAPDTGDAGSGGPDSPVERTGPGTPAGTTAPTAPTAPSAPTPPQAVGAVGVDPARFDPARNAVDRTVHGTSGVRQRPESGADPGDGQGDVAVNGEPARAAGGGAPDARPGPAPLPEADLGTNGHPSPRPAPRRLPRPAPPVNGHTSPDGTDGSAGSEQEWARQWSNGSWAMPSGPPAPERDPDIEPATSPTPTTPPLSRVPPSPTRRAAAAGEPEPDGGADLRPRHRLDTPGVVAPVPADDGRDDVLDSRLTPNEQELLRRLQQELAARERGSAEPPSSPRNGTSHPSED